MNLKHGFTYIVLALLCIPCLYATGAKNKSNSKLRKDQRFVQRYDLPIYNLSGVKFIFKTDGALRGTPAISDGIVCFGSGDNYFYAVDQQSGKEIWKFETNGAVCSSPAIHKGIVYFTSRDRGLYGLKLSDGKQVWKFEMEQDLGIENYWDNTLSSPVITDGRLFLGSNDGNLYSFDINSKKLLWKYNAGSRIKTNPAVNGEHVVFGDNAGYLVSVSKSGGALQWKFATDGVKNKFEEQQNDRTSVYCTPAIADDIVVSGGRDGIIYAVDLNTGKERWRVDHKGPWILSVAIKDNVAYVGCGSDAMLQALDLNTGKEKWEFKANDAIFSALTLAGDMIYLSDFSGNLHAIDMKAGKEHWSFPMGYRSFSTPVTADGVIYCGSEKGTLYALQGNLNSDTAAPVPRKIVYWEKKKTDTAFTYFASGVDGYIRDYLVINGYELLDAKQLKQAMADAVNKKLPSVVVFAGNLAPHSVTDSVSGQAPLIRKYLDAGGKAVVFGINPLAIVTDSVTGQATALNYAIPEQVFNIKYAGKRYAGGFFTAFITPEGQKNGLSDSWSGFSGFTPIIPDQTVEVLAKDEYGKPVAWVKNFGGKEGTGLLQLYVPITEAYMNMADLRAVIEHGVSW